VSLNRPDQRYADRLAAAFGDDVQIRQVSVVVVPVPIGPVPAPEWRPPRRSKGAHGNR
jgi:hypothetical protein